MDVLTISENLLPEELRSYNIHNTLKLSNRRRTISIQIEENGDLCIYAPIKASEKVIKQFLQDKKDWILKYSQRNRLRSIQFPKKKYIDGESFLFLGKEYPLRLIKTTHKRFKIEHQQGCWQLSVPEVFSQDNLNKQIYRKITQWYEQQAKEILPARLFYYGRLMNDEVNEIRVKKQNSLWGCCEYFKRSITLNWLLILCPMSVIDYVVVHELSHLKYPDHSKQFWNRVAKFYPNYKTQQKWLKDNQYRVQLPAP